MEAVLDAPVGPDGGGEGGGGELRGGEVVSTGDGGPAVALDGGLDHADHGEVGEAPLVREAAVGKEPAGVVADDGAADLNATVVAVGGLVGEKRTCGGGVEVEPDLLGEGGPGVLQGEKGRRRRARGWSRRSSSGSPWRQW